MQRARITIDKEGNYTIDLMEGFSGMSCEQKADQIALICGGIEKDRREKPEYYDSEDMFNDMFGGGSY